GQCRARHLAAQSDVVEFAGHGTQTRLDVAETLAVSQLSERHRQKLVPARKASQVIVATVACDAFVKLVRGQVIHQLSENGATDIHAPFCRLRQSLRSKPFFALADFKSKNVPLPVTFCSHEPYRIFGNFSRTAMIINSNVLYGSACIVDHANFTKVDSTYCLSETVGNPYSLAGRD